MPSTSCVGEDLSVPIGIADCCAGGESCLALGCGRDERGKLKSCEGELKSRKCSVPRGGYGALKKSPPTTGKATQASITFLSWPAWRRLASGVQEDRRPLKARRPSRPHAAAGNESNDLSMTMDSRVRQAELLAT